MGNWRKGGSRRNLMETEIKNKMAKRRGKKYNFFHQAMVQERQRNRILSIRDQNGEIIVEKEGIEQVLVEYHKDILAEPLVDRTEAIK